MIFVRSVAAVLICWCFGRIIFDHTRGFAADEGDVGWIATVVLTWALLEECGIISPQALWWKRKREGGES